MKDQQHPYRKHPDPFVQIILNTELVPDKILAALTLPQNVSNPKVQAILLIMLADSGFKSFAEANKFAESVYMQPCHVDLQLIYLATWFGILTTIDPLPLDQMNVIQSTMNSLASENTPPEIKTIIKCVQGANYSFRRDYTSCFKNAERILDGLDHDSPYYKKFAILCAHGYLEHGMGTDIHDILNEVTPSEYDEKGLIIAKLADCVLTGKILETPQLIDRIATFPEHKFRKMYSEAFEMSCSLIPMMFKLRGLAPPSALTKDQSDHKQSWLLSTEALLQHKSEEALHWARIFTDQASTRLGKPLDFIDHTLVRAELAIANGSGAKRLLLHLRDQGTQTYFDDFYFARAERLLGNHEAAKAHFTKLKASIEKYEAQKRLDFEVAMACEMGVYDLLELGAPTIDINKENLVFNQPQKSNKIGLDSIVSTSLIMQEVKDAILRFANLDFPVLISGETGTGKELIANALHHQSQRKNNKFIAVNCGSISDTLIESEFFGHAPGAFTGASSAYKGIFREAGEGTVFLDEIADISPQLQVALLRVLETGEIRPVGSSDNFQIKCRVIVASNRPLLELVEEGIFRQDLYYRLQRLEIKLPALRERIGDILEIATHFFNSERNLGQEVTLKQNLIDRFSSYHWPGNVRELRNVVQKMRILSSDKLHYDLSDLIRCGYELINKIENTDITPISQPDLKDNQNVDSILTGATNTHRRKQKLRKLFEEYGELKVSEVAEILGVTRNTASSYMIELCNEGVIEKITPTASPKSQYYVKCKNH